MLRRYINNAPEDLIDAESYYMKSLAIHRGIVDEYFYNEDIIRNIIPAAMQALQTLECFIQLVLDDTSGIDTSDLAILFTLSNHIEAFCQVTSSIKARAPQVAVMVKWLQKAIRKVEQRYPRVSEYATSSSKTSDIGEYHSSMKLVWKHFYAPKYSTLQSFNLATLLREHSKTASLDSKRIIANCLASIESMCDLSDSDAQLLFTELERATTAITKANERKRRDQDDAEYLQSLRSSSNQVAQHSLLAILSLAVTDGDSFTRKEALVALARSLLANANADDLAFHDIDFTSLLQMLVWAFESSNVSTHRMRSIWLRLFIEMMVRNSQFSDEKQKLTVFTAVETEQYRLLCKAPERSFTRHGHVLRDEVQRVLRDDLKMLPSADGEDRFLGSLQILAAYLGQLILAHAKIFSNAGSLVESIKSLATSSRAELQVALEATSNALLQIECKDALVLHSLSALIKEIQSATQCFATVNTSGIKLALAQLGYAWFYSGKLSIELYLRNYPMDPAEKTELKRHVKKLELLKSEASLEYLLAVQEITSGNLETLEICQLHAEIAQLEGEISRPDNMTILRPERSELTDIEGEFRQILKRNKDAHMKPGESYALYGLENAAVKLNSNYPLYGDLVSPVIFAIGQMEYGIAAFEQCRTLIETSKKSDMLLYLANIYPQAAQTTNQETVVDLARPRREFDAISSPVQTARLVALQLRQIGLQVKLKRIIDAGDLSLVAKVSYQIWNTWRELKAAEAEKQGSDSLYRHKESVQKILTEDELLEQDFKERFPDFNSEFTDCVDVQAHDTVETIAAGFKQSGTTESQAESFDTFMENIAKISREYQGLFSSFSAEFKFNFESFIQEKTKIDDEAADFLQDILPEINRPEYDASLRVMNVSRLWKLHRDLNVADDTADSVEINAKGGFNYGYDMKFTLRVHEQISRVISRLGALLDTWPEHTVLLQAFSICHRIHSLPLFASIARLLTGLEFLHDYMGRWEEFASRDVSLEAEINLIARLIIACRRFDQVLGITAR